MKIKSCSQFLETVSVGLGEAPTESAEALRGVLLAAAADLPLLECEDPEGAKSSALAAKWIARLVPVWRELAAQNRDPSLQRDPAAAAPGDVDLALQLIDKFSTALAAFAPQAVQNYERHAAIEKAKHEWECTADALTAMVCLIDSDGLVLRANRVVEHWGLGSVSSVIGKRVHAVLHAACNDRHCKVVQGLEDALSSLRGGKAYEFEFYSAASDQTLQFTLRPMRIGDDTAAPPGTRAVLVVTDVSALRRAQQALESVNLNLESRVRLRTRELGDSNHDLRGEVARREHAEKELRASRNNLALLSEQLIQAQEGERRRIALELHDSVGQSLSAIKYTLERAIIMIQRGNLGSPEKVLALAVQRIHETADGIRAISMNLRPQMLDNLGAASATSWFCRGFAEIYPMLAVRTEISAKNEEIPKRISTHLFRCVQELLNNVAKHAQATSVRIVLKREGLALSVEVRDDGMGMPHHEEHPARLHGSGIRNIRERAEMTGGRFSIASLEHGGTSARVIWQLNADDDGDQVRT